ncbi:M14 family zinc carboxypeptidase [Thalassotalea aquiviva]|uniref:M14 family zinc carboxypeptidase n=1 Tax=Thalassotalea aquiviva TaxID=3242415 RepID=UPI00352B8303
MRNRILRWCSIACFSLSSTWAVAAVVMKPTPLPEAQYPAILKGNYHSNITKPEAILGFEVGERTATPEQITELVTLWASESERAHIVEYARSYEDRPLHYLVISAPENLNNLAQIKDNIASLSHPSKLSDAQAKTLIEQTPATAWMAYSIHGNETSGADGALALIYHLLASTDTDVVAMLDQLIVLVDPLMNPDGRARFSKNLQEHRATAPNFDTQSLLHSGIWPFGRTNHYMFDLNRDFYFAVNPESRGRIKAINQWYPLLMIDGHEMGALDNFLFGPPREPINKHIASSIKRWSDKFATDQAAQFDQNQWPYYTGEWFENLYPGYSNYAEYRGSIHILYEQARTAEDGVRLANGSIRSYKQSADHQFVSSLANLKTLQQNRQQIFADFVKNRRANIASNGPYANKSFVILPTDNHARLANLLDLLRLQNIDYFFTTKEMKLDDAKNHLGQIKDTNIPKGSVVIPNRQFEAPLIAAIMEFDAEISEAVLLEERQKTLRNGGSIMYDSTAWNLSMMFGLPALEVNEHIRDNLTKESPSYNPGLSNTDNAIAYLVDGASDKSVAFAARLMEQDIKVRVLDKEARFNNQSFNRGTVVVTHHDNLMDEQTLVRLVETTAQETKTKAIAINQGLGAGDLPDIGGRHFRLLTKPQLGLITQNGISPGDFGSLWHMIDTELGIRHSHLANDLLARSDLRQYNVLVIPGRWYGSLSKASVTNLDTWTKQGGTLIVMGNSANQFIAKEGISKVKPLKASLEKAQEFNIALYREWLAEQDNISNQTLVANHKVPDDVWFPWAGNDELKPMSKEQLEQWEAWSANFMPSGAMIATRTDQQHWLTFGVEQQLPVLTSNGPLFMVNQGAQAVVRYGVLVDNPKAQEKMIGWSTIPQGKDLYVRMSGLVWPEAAQRIANTAYLTREASGKGQIILFADSPTFRGATKGTARLLLNAMIYGPGLGARAQIEL